MGFADSSHYFNKVVQKHLEDTPDTKVEVDDLFTKGDGPDDAIDSFREVLVRCRAKKIYLARHKLDTREEVNFSGTHIGGPMGYRPTQGKIDPIIKLKPPQNITELCSFIGCVNQLRNYMPDFQHSMSNLQKLLRKGVPYIWDNTMQQDFNQIKDILRSPLGLSLSTENGEPSCTPTSQGRDFSSA